jgi:hypothetical protein
MARRMPRIRYYGLVGFDLNRVSKGLLFVNKDSGEQVVTTRSKGACDQGAIRFLHKKP